jgi:Zn finger protein HypA/HybF involved in hydrogenase expression
VLGCVFKSTLSEDTHTNLTAQGIVLKCEHCGEVFVYELRVPIAVRCTKCESVFDARLSIIKKYKQEWKELTGPS